MDCIIKIFNFINKLKYFTGQISRQNFFGFAHLGNYESTDNTFRTILKHLSNLVVESNSRFLDLKLIKFPSWITQPFLLHCVREEGLEMDCDLVNELLFLRNDDIMKPTHASKN